MLAPFGKQDFKNDNRFSVKLTIKGGESDELMLKIRQFEENLMDKAQQCSTSWFGKSMSPEDIESSFTSCIKTFEIYPPMQHVKVRHFNIPKGTSLNYIIEFGGVWVRRGKFPMWGVNWKVQDII